MNGRTRATIERVRDRLLVPAYVFAVPWMLATFRFNIQWSDLVFVLVLTAFAVTARTRDFNVAQLDLFVVGYLAAVGLSLIGTSSLLRGAEELAKTLSGALVYVVVGAMAREEGPRRRLVGWMAAVTIGVCGIGVAALAGHMLFGLPPGALGHELRLPYFGSVLRLSVGFHTPELFGNYLTCMAVFVSGWLLVERRGFLQAIAGTTLVAVVVLAELLTFSHSWAGFLVAGVIFSWNRWEGVWWTRTRRLAAATACALMIVVNLASTFYVEEWSIERRMVPAPAASVPEHVVQRAEWSQLHVSATYGVLYYLLLKVLAWEAFRAHPVAGVGLGNFHSVTERAYADGRIAAVCRECFPHSTPFGHAAETGLIGTGALIALWAAIVMTIRRLSTREADASRRWPLDASLAGFIGLMVNSINADVMHFRFLWLMLAIVRGYALGARPPGRSTAPPST